MELEALTILLVRLVGLAMIVVSLVWGIGNVWRNWPALHPAFIGHFLAKQTTHTTTLAVAGLVLIGLAKPIGAWLTQGLV